MEEDKQTTIVIPNKSTMKSIVDVLVNKRPHGWSRKSYPTYYKRVYAEWIQKDIDAMLIDRQPRLYALERFKGITLQSLYLRVIQSIMYLVDPINGMDNDKKYAFWREIVKIHRQKKPKYPVPGIRLSFDVVIEGDEFADIIKGDESIPVWKKELDVYLTSKNPDGRPFHRVGLCLSQEQIDLLEAELSGLEPHVIHSITGREIKVVKMS